MSKWVKIGGGVVVVLIVLVVGGVFLLYSQLNDIVRAAVEQVGTEVTGTEVRLGEVDIEVESGKGTMRGFQLRNPDGFEADNAFKFDEVSVTLDVATVFSDPVIVKEVVVDGPQIVYEVGEWGGESNFDRIQNNVQSFADAQGGGASAPAESSGGSEGPNLLIENVYLRNVQMGVRVSALSDEAMSVGMPDVHLTDVGSSGGDQGASPAAIAEEILSELTGDIQGTVANINIGELFGDLGKEAEALATGAVDAAGDAAGAAGSAVEDAGSAASDAVSEGVGSVKKLFGE